ncbi:hypothetical protein CIPAW_10G116200 [Carya illinoinensis]|uniref:Uncharacterized protein n=1 Tax=Carya illinoinensis TaxID=32201 RepID=A0A8T1PEY0_CARIL|nr:hypothetical protein CIPAW_10G116200 [Carya illinoinensis]
MMMETSDGEKMPARSRTSWSPEEDNKLKAYIKRYGIWNWSQMPQAAGLTRSRKSCRLQWMNYLRPDTKRGNFSQEEKETIVKCHELLGNRTLKLINYKNDSSGNQDLLLCDSPKVPNMDGFNGIQTSPQIYMSINDVISSSSSTDPLVEDVINQYMIDQDEINFSSSNASEIIQSIWEQPHFSFQDIFMPETDPEFMAPTTARWHQEPMYSDVCYDTGYDFWVD